MCVLLQCTHTREAALPGGSKIGTGKGETAGQKVGHLLLLHSSAMRFMPLRNGVCVCLGSTILLLSGLQIHTLDFASTSFQESSCVDAFFLSAEMHQSCSESSEADDCTVMVQSVEVTVLCPF